MKRVLCLLGSLAVGAVLGTICGCDDGDDDAQTDRSSISSRFESSDEGWTVLLFGHGGTIAPRYDSISECISVTRDATGGQWYWVAPAKFLGDISGSYGKKLSFDLKRSELPSGFAVAHRVTIAGPAMTIVFDAAKEPGNAWTRYTVPLTAARWTREDGSPLTRAEMNAVLGGVTALRISGESGESMMSGDGVGSLDDVVLQR